MRRALTLLALVIALVAGAGFGHQLDVWNGTAAAPAALVAGVAR